ncbi:MAG: hypothetical protein Q9162_003218 [Coniocarpon cinnabarinum]
MGGPTNGYSADMACREHYPLIYLLSGKYSAVWLSQVRPVRGHIVELGNASGDGQSRKTWEWRSQEAAFRHAGHEKADQDSNDFSQKLEAYGMRKPPDRRGPYDW